MSIFAAGAKLNNTSFLKPFLRVSVEGWSQFTGSPWKVYHWVFLPIFFLKLTINVGKSQKTCAGRPIFFFFSNHHTLHCANFARYVLPIMILTLLEMCIQKLQFVFLKPSKYSGFLSFPGSRVTWWKSCHVNITF